MSPSACQAIRHSISWLPLSSSNVHVSLNFPLPSHVLQQSSNDPLKSKKSARTITGSYWTHILMITKVLLGFHISKCILEHVAQSFKYLQQGQTLGMDLAFGDRQISGGLINTGAGATR